jgi:hypothetical protein
LFAGNQLVSQRSKLRNISVETKPDRSCKKTTAEKETATPNQKQK